MRWPGPSPTEAVSALRSLVSEVRTRGDAGGPLAERFIERLAATSRHRRQEDDFAGEVSRWLEYAEATGEGKLRLVVNRVLAGRQLARPLRLGARYVRSVFGRMVRPQSERDLREWRRYLKGDVR